MSDKIEFEAALVRQTRQERHGTVMTVMGPLDFPTLEVPSLVKVTLTPTSYVNSREWAANESRRARIESHYRDIVEIIKTATLYGLPVDASDPKAVAVAAYHMGLREQFPRFGTVEGAER
jgi:hypothetical protein